MRRIVLITASLAAMLAWLMPAPVSASSGPAAGLAELPFSVRVNAANIDWFNNIARATDIASFNARDLTLLDKVTRGRKQVIFASAADAEQQVPGLAGKVDIIGYDLEHWPQTPPDEQADPVSAAKRMRALADRYGLELAIGPDRRFTADYGVDLAPLSDYYVLQLQRLQSDTPTLRAFADPLITSLRQANPNLRIIVQLSSGGTADDVVALLNTMQGQVDAVNLLANSSTLPVAQEIVSRLQAGAAELSPTATAVDTLLPPETNRALVPTAVPMPQPELPLLRVDLRQALLFAGIGLLALLLAVALVAAAVFRADRRARRSGVVSGGDGDWPPPGDNLQ